MKSVLFNIHDVALIVTVVACMLLATKHIVSECHPKSSRYWFGLFLLATALAGVNTLLLWSEPIRHPAFDKLPYLYLFLGAVTFLLGPLLYWQLNAHLNSHFRFELKQSIHLIPALLAIVYLYWECFQFPQAVQRDLLLNLKLYRDPTAFYANFITLKKLLPVVYGCACIRLLIRQPYSPSTPSPTDGNARDQWLVVTGFTAIWLWAAVTHFFGRQHPGEISDAMGIAGNYLKLGLVVLLLCRASLHSSPSFRSTGKTKEGFSDQPQIERVRTTMTKDKAYLNPQLTLERFAAMARCSTREVSVIVNNRFHQNFHEFVNHYRMEEVKRRLRDSEYNQWSIADIAQSAGFNSKATFHRLFKNTQATTPSAYRKRHQTVNAAPPVSSHRPYSSQTA